MSYDGLEWVLMQSVLTHITSFELKLPYTLAINLELEGCQGYIGKNTVDGWCYNYSLTTCEGFVGRRLQIQRSTKIPTMGCTKAYSLTSCEEFVGRRLQIQRSAKIPTMGCTKAYCLTMHEEFGVRVM